MYHLLSPIRCLDTLISGQAAKMKATLGDIWVLEKAADTANKRLSFLEMQDDVSRKHPFLLFCAMYFYRPYANMAAILKLFCLHSNQPY